MISATTNSRGILPTASLKLPRPHHRRRPNLSRLLSILFVFIHYWQLADAFHRQLTAGELLYTFGVDRHEHVPPYHLVHAQREHQEKEAGVKGGDNKVGTRDTRKLSFNAWNRTYVIELEPNHRLLSPHLSFIVRNGDSAVERRGVPSHWGANCHFHGRVVSHGHVRAAISDCNERLMGVLVEDDHFLVLQTIPHRMVKANVTHPPYVVYRRDPQLSPNSRESTGLQHLWKASIPHASATLDHKHRRRKRADPPVFENSTDGGEDSDEESSFCDVSVSKSLDEPLAWMPSASAVALTASVFSAQPVLIGNLLQLNYSLPSEANLDSLFVFPQLDPITLEIGLFLDAQLYEHFKREFTADPDQHLTDFSLALINNVHVLYQQPTLQPNLDIVIVRFEMWKKQPAPLATEMHKNGQAQTLLDSFCRHQARINPGTDLTDPGHWDHAVLLTGYDIYHTTSSVAGVAPVGRMCDELFACSLVEGLHLGRSFVLAHEMGHKYVSTSDHNCTCMRFSMGMVHDGVQNQCGRSCCLMSAVNGAGKTRWSTCSVREFNAFLLQLDDSGRGNCLRDPAEGLTSHNHLADGRLPGQRFTADQQCSYFWGRDFQVEIPNGRTYDDICRILWCGNSGSTISTAHPALEGSWCGGNRWCHEGKCEDWALMPNYRGPTPSQVDGEWSDWNGAEIQCPVSQCQVTGSITVRSQLRTCTNPAPNNGGRPCEGSSVRGLACSPPEARFRCEAFTRQEFGDRLCTAILHDANRPDRSLSGESFLHATQPCKVWCHVRDSELIRNKGQFPNGSPCGLDEYCVSGTCLRLGCNQHAIVASETDCPPSKTTSNRKWESWSKWSECSTTCGNHGVQKRERKCKSPDGDCAGKASELRECSPSPPPCPPEFGPWEMWSPCVSHSGKCSTWGRRKRGRKCLTSTEPRTAPQIPCPLEKLEEEEECQTESCPQPKWSEWGEWTTCSVSCGAGQRQRRRHCSESILERGIVGGRGGCEGESTEISACFPKACEKDSSAVAGEWSEWGPCSVSCGIGFQLRERRCVGGLCPTEHGKQARTCNVQDCSRVKDAPIWSEWGLWSVCSHTCGQGVQERHRRCLNHFCRDAGREETTESKRCVLGPCPEWGEWGTWSGCTTPCNPFESRRRHRQCTVRVGDGANADEEVEVAKEACQQSAGLATELDSCEKDCLKNSTSASNTTTTDLTAEDNSGRLSKWSDWTEWSPCSRSCGGGRQTRRRRCLAELIFLCDGSYAKEERPCNNTIPCPPDPATSLLLSRNTTRATDYPYPEWSAWSEWSGCSCFSLTKYRRRYCRIADPVIQGFCTGSLMEQKRCEPSNCVSDTGGWSEWSEWSRCSRECGEESGYQVRNRMCSAPLPANGGSYCAGYSFDQRSCKSELGKQCPSGGEQATVDGRWSEWQPWSSCSDKCINGQHSRTRYCSNPRPANGGRQCAGSDFEIEACASDLGADCSARIRNNQLATEALLLGNSTRLLTKRTENNTTKIVIMREWSSWSDWSKCPADCGHTPQWRQRFCNVTALDNTTVDAPPPNNMNTLTSLSNMAYMTADCKEKKHCNGSSIIASPHWSEWSVWSTCTPVSVEKNSTGNSTALDRASTYLPPRTRQQTRRVASE